MSNLKDLISGLQGDGDQNTDDTLDVHADSVKQALELASKELGVDISMLDYEIISRGKSGFFGLGRKAYRVLVSVTEPDTHYDDVFEIEKKLSNVDLVKVNGKGDRDDIDGEFKVRVTKSGIWLYVTPPKGKGKKIDVLWIHQKLNSLRITNIEKGIIENFLKNPSDKPLRIGEWVPNPEHDGTMTIEVSEDEMNSYVHFVPPIFAGRHMETDDVIEELKNAEVIAGIDNKGIEEYLQAMDYREALLAAKGVKARNGHDAYIEYKVRVDKSSATFEENENGQVDFRDLDLLENVVVGQLLAIKVPFAEGVQGMTVTNKVIPVKSGKDIVFKFGKGTILSDDGLELTAEINGQIIFKNGKICVEPVYVIKGDVSLQTGNIIFLGSVIVTGSVQDNFVVKAAGNIEVKGSVQKAFLEAEGDIIVRNGIVGRDEAKIESTAGSVFAKFIQTATVIAEQDVLALEGIVSSNIDAGKNIYCYGKRARIVGGRLRAGYEVNARYLGSDSFAKTEVRVGINPKILQQISELHDVQKGMKETLAKVEKDSNTLTIQKNSANGYLTPDKENLLKKVLSQKHKLSGRVNEVKLELEELRSYLGMLIQRGKVCVEKEVFPGVDIYIKDERFSVKDPYNYLKVSLDNNNEIKLSEYEPPAFIDNQEKVMTVVRKP